MAKKVRMEEPLQQPDGTYARMELPIGAIGAFFVFSSPDGVRGFYGPGAAVVELELDEEDQP
jgi:hypothetical protein